MNPEEAIEFTCPLLKNNCIGNKCMFWLINDPEDESKDECALVMIAKRLTIP